jgi:hypothetical protein
MAKLIDTVSKAIKRGVALPRRARHGLSASAAARDPRKNATRLPQYRAVLLLGETGSGFKCARFLHQP